MWCLLEVAGPAAVLSGEVADLMPGWELHSRAHKGSSRWTELCRVPTAALIGMLNLHILGMD